MDILREYLISFDKNTICYKHAVEIAKSCDFINIVDSIINDMLMGRVHVENKQLCLRLNKRILDLIFGWYDLSKKLVIYNTENISVYRGISNIIYKDKILQPIPFSTCIDFENSLNWIYPDDDNSFVMKINIKSGYEYTYTGNMDEGNEVVLPAGILNKINQIKIEEYNIIEYDFEPFSVEQMIENFKNIKTEFF